MLLPYLARFKILEMFQRESEESGRRIFLFTLLSGAANTSLLAITNLAAQQANSSTASSRYLFMFICALVLFIVCQKFILRRTTLVVESVIMRIRTRIAGKIRLCDYRRMEQLGRTEVHARLTKDASVIAQSAPAIMNSVQSMVMVVFSMFYIAYISLTALFFTLAAAAVAGFIYLRTERFIKANLQTAGEEEVKLYSLMEGLLLGLKEIKISKPKGDGAVAEVAEKSLTVKNLKIAALVPYADNYVFAFSFFYCLIAINIFLVPKFIPTHAQVVVMLSTAILFLIGPLGNVVTMVSMLAQTSIAVESIYALEKTLDQIHEETPDEESLPVGGGRPMAGIRLDNVTFAYENGNDLHRFTVGPMNFEVKANEVVFIVGGNGSGKSTLLKLLTGLYRPSEGLLLFNGEPVTPRAMQSYREHFCVIFSDFHLFQRVYGAEPSQAARVQELLREFEIENKTSYAAGAFSTLDLSTGQRKRLALLVALLEDRPVYVFDEWAADQDPHFRRYFYERILPELKSRGKTVIAVTHDEQYMKTADRVVTMDFGKVMPPAESKS